MYAYYYFPQLTSPDFLIFYIHFSYTPCVPHAPPYSNLLDWTETTQQDFFVLLLFLTVMPKFNDHWSRLCMWYSKPQLRWKNIKLLLDLHCNSRCQRGESQAWSIHSTYRHVRLEVLTVVLLGYHAVQSTESKLATASYWFLTWFIFWTWRWRPQVPLKC